MFLWWQFLQFYTCAQWRPSRRWFESLSVHRTYSEDCADAQADLSLCWAHLQFCRKGCAQDSNFCNFTCVPSDDPAESLSVHRTYSEDSGQTARMRRLIWVFAGRTCNLVGSAVPQIKLYANSECSDRPSHQPPDYGLWYSSTYTMYCNIQWFCKMSTKILIRMRRCASGSL